jgi:hypothetical protein
MAWEQNAVTRARKEPKNKKIINLRHFLCHLHKVGDFLLPPLAVLLKMATPTRAVVEFCLRPGLIRSSHEGGISQRILTTEQKCAETKKQHNSHPL